MSITKICQIGQIIANMLNCHDNNINIASDVSDLTDTIHDHMIKIEAMLTN